MPKPYLITATATPLTEDERLHADGLRAHLDAQARAGIDGVLVAGTMGVLQLLMDRTYEDLVRHAVEIWAGQGELLVGAGDTSFSRTRDRIQFVNRFDINGTVVLAPFFIKFSQEELVGYYEALAAESRAPLFLYDQPQLTGTHLEIDTVLRLSRNSNIAGIKCTGDLEQTRQLIDALSDDHFRVIVAKPTLLDMALRHGCREHLDGIFGVAPTWMSEISRCASDEDWPAVAGRIKALTDLLLVVRRYGVFPSITAILNKQGVPGNFAIRPYRPLSSEKRQQLLEEPPVHSLLGSN